MGDRLVRCVFIGGTGRSGSNILKKVLSQNENIFSLPFESRFTVDPDGVFSTFRALTQSVSPFEADLLIDRLSSLLSRLAVKSNKDRLAIMLENIAKKTVYRSTHVNLRAYKEWELAVHFPEFIEKKEILLKRLQYHQYTGVWPAKSGTENTISNTFITTFDRKQLLGYFSDFLNELYSVVLAEHNKNIYLDDNTYNILFSQEILKILPNAHLIHIVRDPRDVVASLAKQRWAPSNIETAIHFYTATMDQCINKTKGISEDQLTVIKLEELCYKPSRVLLSLCNKLNFDVTEDMLAIKLNRANSGRWMQDIPINMHKKINSELAYYINQFGYKI